MPLYAFEGLTPQVHPDAFIAPTATLVGDVFVEAGASVWYGAVIRADYAPVIIRAGANVQENASIHGPPGLTTDVGPGATVAHNCVVHGALLEEECLVANGSVVLDGATIGARDADRRRIGRRRGRARSRPGCSRPDRRPIVKRPLPGTPAEFWVNANPSAYAELAQRHKIGIAIRRGLASGGLEPSATVWGRMDPCPESDPSSA